MMLLSRANNHLRRCKTISADAAVAFNANTPTEDGCDYALHNVSPLQKVWIYF